MSELKALSTSEVEAKLFDRWKNRPLPDPNRPRPVLDALKGILTGLIGEMGPALTPLLLKLLTGLFAGAATPSSADGVTMQALCEELASRHAVSAQGATVSAQLSEFWDLLSEFLLKVAQKVEPDVRELIMDALAILLGRKSE